jgi:hypothetical protein
MAVGRTQTLSGGAYHDEYRIGGTSPNGTRIPGLG